MQKLKNKVAIVYGNGGVGSAIAKAFATEGATVFFTGRTLAKMKAVADEVGSTGGHVYIDQLDALDETAVERHMDAVIEKAGKVDISFNAIGLPQTGHQGTPLAALSLHNFIHPVITYTQSHFITARAAVKRMVGQKHGIVIMNTPSPSRISVPFMGGMPSAWAAIEALSRTISAECGAHGVRSVSLLTTAMPDSTLIDEVYNLHAKAHGINYAQFHSAMENKTHIKRLTSLDDLAKAAVFVASEDGDIITGTVLNLTAGMIVN